MEVTALGGVLRNYSSTAVQPSKRQGWNDTRLGT